MFNRLLRWFFIGFLFSFSIFSFISKDRILSERENRLLTQKPEFTIERVLKGKFMEEYEEYVKDQFPLRDIWISLKAEADYVRGKRDQRNIYIGKDDFLLENFQKPSSQFYKNVEQLKRFLDNSNIPNRYVLIAPTSAGIYPEKLPKTAEQVAQKEWLDYLEEELDGMAIFINPFPILLEKKEEPIYFRTDHHWTMRGAFYAYQEAASRMNVAPKKIEDFQIKTHSDNFYGTFHARVNKWSIPPDKIEIFHTLKPVNVELHFQDRKESSDSLYMWDFLEKHNQYDVFLGGNHRLLTITTSNENGRKLAVIKDSYAHAMIPFFIHHFEEIHVIDARFFRGNLHHYLEECDITDLLFLYNLSEFATNRHILPLLPR